MTCTPSRFRASSNCPLDHLYAGPLLASHFAGEGLTDHDTVVVSPDVGGVGRARGMAEMLHSPLAIIAKRRPEPNQVEIMEIIGDVRGKTCVMVDDMIDTGGSIVSGACALMDRGARRIVACCTHPVLSGPAVERIEHSPITELVITDTIPYDDDKRLRSSKIKVISVAPLLASAIRRIHKDDSVSGTLRYVLVVGAFSGRGTGRRGRPARKTPDGSGLRWRPASLRGRAASRRGSGRPTQPCARHRAAPGHSPVQYADCGPCPSHPHLHLWRRADAAPLHVAARRAGLVDPNAAVRTLFPQFHLSHRR